MFKSGHYTCPVSYGFLGKWSWCGPSPLGQIFLGKWSWCGPSPKGQKSLEMAHEPRGVCFKLWVKKSCSCFLLSPRSHVGDVLWNSEPDPRRQFSRCFWSAFLVFRKMRFRTKSAKTYHPKHTRKCPVFGYMGEYYSESAWIRPFVRVKFIFEWVWHLNKCFLHHFTLFFFTFVKSHNVLCLVLS